MSLVITASLVKLLRERTGAGMMDCKKALVKVNGNIELAIDEMRKFGQIKVFKKVNRIASEGIVIAAVSNDYKFGALLEINCETDFVAKDSIFLEFSNKLIKFIILNKISNIEELKLRFKLEHNDIIIKIGENINIRRLKILEGENIGYYLHNSRIGVIVSSKNTDHNFIKYIAMHIAASKPEYITSDDIPLSIISHERSIQLDIAMKSGKSYEIAEKIVAGRMSKFINQITLIGQPFIMDLNKTVGLLLKEKNITIFDFIRFEVGEGIDKI